MTADYAIRNYSGSAVKTYLTTGMTTGDTATTINDPTGWPLSAFWAVFDVGTVNEELVYVGTRSGSNLTGIVRNITGAGAKTHQAGSSTAAWHTGAFQDFVEANAVAAALTTKGDSLWKGGTASVAPARLAAGLDQQIIRYKAANSLGVETTFAGSTPIFASMAARDAAITSPVEGMICVTTTEKRQWTYDGTRWLPTTWYSRAGRPGVRLTAANIVAMGTGTNQNISWNTEVQDLDGWIASPSTTVTVPTGHDGMYYVACGASTDNGSGAQQLSGTVNGTVFQSVTPAPGNKPPTGLLTPSWIGNNWTGATGTNVDWLVHVFQLVAGDALIFNIANSAGANRTYSNIQLEVALVAR